MFRVRFQRSFIKIVRYGCKKDNALTEMRNLLYRKVISTTIIMSVRKLIGKGFDTMAISL